LRWRFLPLRHLLRTRITWLGLTCWSPLPACPVHRPARGHQGTSQLPIVPGSQAVPARLSLLPKCLKRTCRRNRPYSQDMTCKPPALSRVPGYDIKPRRSPLYRSFLISSNQWLLARYHWMVSLKPASKVCFGVHPSSFLILVASMA